MTKVLLVKMSSMGDLVHTLPALSDAKKHLPEITFDWVVEPSFAHIPLWHPAVSKVIPCALRTWRKSPWQSYQGGEWQTFVRALRQEKYDVVIDAQGLVKSAIVARFARGPKHGYNFNSAREGVASLFYDVRHAVNHNVHAVEKLRHLFASVFQYPVLRTAPDYGLTLSPSENRCASNTVIFLHGTTWPTKHWPVAFWQRLCYLVSRAGYNVQLPWGNAVERERAYAIQSYLENKGVPLPEVLPQLSLNALSLLIAKARGIVAVDTGLGHVAAAMGTPTVSLYGPTDPLRTGTYGDNQVHLKSTWGCSPCLGRMCRQGQNHTIQPPCFEALQPETVWQQLLNLMTQSTTRRSRTSRTGQDEHTAIL